MDPIGASTTIGQTDCLLKRDRAATLGGAFWDGPGFTINDGIADAGSMAGGSGQSAL